MRLLVCIALAAALLGCGARNAPVAAPPPPPSAGPSFIDLTRLTEADHDMAIVTAEETGRPLTS